MHGTVVCEGVDVRLGMPFAEDVPLGERVVEGEAGSDTVGVCVPVCATRLTRMEDHSRRTDAARIVVTNGLGLRGSVCHF